MCATKKSLDCFASLAMTAFYIHAKPRRRKAPALPPFQRGCRRSRRGFVEKELTAKNAKNAKSAKKGGVIASVGARFIAPCVFWILRRRFAPRSKRSPDKRSAIRESKTRLTAKNAKKGGVIASAAKQSRKCAQQKNRWIASLRSQ